MFRRRQQPRRGATAAAGGGAAAPTAPPPRPLTKPAPAGAESSAPAGPAADATTGVSVAEATPVTTEAAAAAPASYKLAEAEAPPPPAGAGAEAGEPFDEEGFGAGGEGKRAAGAAAGEAVGGGEEEGAQSGGSAAAAAAAPSGGEVLDMGMFLDEKALMAAWSFPISAEELVSKAKDILAKGVHRCQDQMSEDFTFSAPFIGPLNKEAFAATMEALDIDAAFPDMQARIYNMRADPLEPGRVWLTSRPLGRNLGYLRLSVPFASAPTGRLVELPPQTSSLVFGADGRVEAWTYGYVMDRRAGNSGGLGGAFGLLWAIGSPFPYPEGHPWSSSWQQRLFNSGSALGKLGALLLDRALSALLPEWLITAHARNTC